MSEYIKNGVASRTFNTDCLLKMKEYPDGYFDLAVVDPPYGGGGYFTAGTERGSVAGSRNTPLKNRRRMGS